jgi:DNA-binding response OmpR family regulator
MTTARANSASDRSGRESSFVLVVDSDLQSLFTTSTLLQRFAYQTHTASTGGEALAIAAVKAPSLVISSLDLTDMEGVELMQKLKKSPATADVPVITLVKQGDPVEGKRGLLYGAVDCLMQPVSAELLFRAVQAVVEKTPRRNMRIKTMQPVKVDNLPLNDTEGAYTLDLSEHGMFLRTGTPAALNTRLSLQIDLNGRIVPLEAAVIYSDRTGRGQYREPGMGLGFVRIEPKDRECIRQFIMHEVMRGIAPRVAL